MKARSSPERTPRADGSGRGASIPAVLPAQRRAGIRAVTLPFGRGTGGLTRGHKTTEYLAAVSGRLYAERRRADDAIFVESDGTVSEGTSSNIFVVKRRSLSTPPLVSGCLPGITRALVLAEARRARLQRADRAESPWIDFAQPTRSSSRPA